MLYNIFMHSITLVIPLVTFLIVPKSDLRIVTTTIGANPLPLPRQGPLSS
jgi:hypothetical protein